MASGLRKESSEAVAAHPAFAASPSLAAGLGFAADRAFAMSPLVAAGGSQGSVHTRQTSLRHLKAHSRFGWA